jgi:hypothetical protein
LGKRVSRSATRRRAVQRETKNETLAAGMTVRNARGGSFRGEARELDAATPRSSEPNPSRSTRVREAEEAYLS